MRTKQQGIAANIYKSIKTKTACYNFYWSNDKPQSLPPPPSYSKAISTASPSLTTTPPPPSKTKTTSTQTPPPTTTTTSTQTPPLFPPIADKFWESFHYLMQMETLNCFLTDYKDALITTRQTRATAKTYSLIADCDSMFGCIIYHYLCLKLSTETTLGCEFIQPGHSFALGFLAKKLRHLVFSHLTENNMLSLMHTSFKDDWKTASVDFELFTVFDTIINQDRNISDKLFGYTKMLPMFSQNSIKHPIHLEQTPTHLIIHTIQYK